MFTRVWCAENTSKDAERTHTHTHIRWPNRITFSLICTHWNSTVCRTIMKSSIRHWTTSSICWIQHSVRKQFANWTVRTLNHHEQSTAQCIIRALSAWITSNSTITATLCCKHCVTSHHFEIIFCAKKTTIKSNVHQVIQSSIWFNALANWCEKCGIREISKHTFRHTKCFRRSCCGVISAFKSHNKAIQLISCRGFWTQFIVRCAASRVRRRRSSINHFWARWKFTHGKFHRQTWTRRRRLYLRLPKNIKRRVRRHRFCTWHVIYRLHHFLSTSSRRTLFRR